MLINEKAMATLANDLAFELQDNRNEDSPNPYADGVWAGIYHLVCAQATTANSIEGINVEPWKVRMHIEEQVKLAFADLFPHDYYPEDDD